MSTAAKGKAARLALLKARIEREHRRKRLFSTVWFWPGRDGVKGFLGTAPIIVAGLNPSKGRTRTGPHQTDKFFYRCLRQAGLAGAHITDIIKISATRGDVPLLTYDPRILRLHRKYFRDEVKVIEPAAVVVMGDETWNILRGWRRIIPTGDHGFVFRVPGGSTVPALHTVHPAATRWPQRTAERRTRFKKTIQEARRLLDSRRANSSHSKPK